MGQSICLVSSVVVCCDLGESPATVWVRNRGQSPSLYPLSFINAIENNPYILTAYFFIQEVILPVLPDSRILNYHPLTLCSYLVLGS